MQTPLSEGFRIHPVVFENLESLSQKQSELAEGRICEIAAAADEMARFSAETVEEGIDPVDTLTLFFEEEKSDSPMPVGTLARNIARLKRFSGLITLFDREVFCDLYLEKMKEIGLPLRENGFLPEDPGSDAISCMKNPLSDEAYTVFAEEMEDPRVRYGESMAELCKNVADGISDYCLLPLEEHGARLTGISALLYRFDLKIAGVTPVFGFSGDADMKYALVSRGFRVPEVEAEDDRYLEIRLPFDPVESTALSDLLSAAGSFGYSVYRIHTQSMKGEGGEVPTCSIVFRDEGKDFLPLLVYLTLFVRDFVPVGIYKNLD